MLWDHVAISGVVEVPVHHAHLEGVHDAVEEGVVELDTVPVAHPLVPLEADGHGHGRSIVGVFRLEHGFILYEGSNIEGYSTQ